MPLDLSGATVSFPAQSPFRPPHLRGITIAGDKELEFLLDRGDGTQRTSEADAREAIVLFLTGLALPNEVFRVNLKPDSPQDIIDSRLANTDAGKIMLEADVRLKKNVARHTSPDSKAGREYWNRLNKKAEELFGNTSCPMPTVSRPWIIPDEIIIRETGKSIYIYKATLKVMLEQDYLKAIPRYSFSDNRLKALNAFAAELMRELIVPIMTREVNRSREYAPLRQVYYSLILAQGVKSNHAELGGQYGLQRLDSRQPVDVQACFREYKTSFEQGEYNRQETSITSGGQKIRSYFSGGILFDGLTPSPMGGSSRISIAARNEIRQPRFAESYAVSLMPSGMTLRTAGPTRAAAPGRDGGRAETKTIEQSQNFFFSNDPGSLSEDAIKAALETGILEIADANFAGKTLDLDGARLRFAPGRKTLDAWAVRFIDDKRFRENLDYFLGFITRTMANLDITQTDLALSQVMSFFSKYSVRELSFEQIRDIFEPIAISAGNKTAEENVAALYALEKLGDGLRYSYSETLDFVRRAAPAKENFLELCDFYESFEYHFRGSAPKTKQRFLEILFSQKDKSPDIDFFRKFLRSANVRKNGPYKVLSAMLKVYTVKGTEQRVWQVIDLFEFFNMSHNDEWLKAIAPLMKKLNGEGDQEILAYAKMKGEVGNRGSFLYTGGQVIMDAILEGCDAETMARALGVHIFVARFLKTRPSVISKLANPAFKRDINYIMSFIGKEQTGHPVEQRVGEDEKIDILHYLFDKSELSAERAIFDAYFKNDPDKYRLDAKMLKRIKDTRLFELLTREQLLYLIKAIRNDPRKSIETTIAAIKENIETSGLFAADQIPLVMTNIEWMILNFYILERSLSSLYELVSQHVPPGRLPDILIALEQTQSLAEIRELAATNGVSFPAMIKAKLGTVSRKNIVGLMREVVRSGDISRDSGLRQLVSDTLMEMNGFERLQLLAGMLANLSGQEDSGYRAVLRKFLDETTRQRLDEIASNAETPAAVRQELLVALFKGEKAGIERLKKRKREMPEKVFVAFSGIGDEIIDGYEKKEGYRLTHIFYEPLLQMALIRDGSEREVYDEDIFRDFSDMFTCKESRDLPAETRNRLYETLKALSKDSQEKQLRDDFKGLLGYAAHKRRGESLEQLIFVINRFLEIKQINSYVRRDERDRRAPVAKEIIDLTEMIMNKLLHEQEMDEQAYARLRVMTRDLEDKLLLNTLFRSSRPSEQEEQALLSAIKNYKQSEKFKRQDKYGDTIFSIIRKYLAYKYEEEFFDTMREAVHAEIRGRFPGFRYSSRDYRKTLERIALGFMDGRQRVRFQAEYSEDEDIFEFLPRLDESGKLIKAMKTIDMLWRNNATYSTANDGKRYTVEITDDFFDLLNLGNSRYFNSCQNARHGGYNEGLSGYMHNGSNKAIVLRNEDGEVVTRRVIRLRLVTDTAGNERPVIFVEENSQFNTLGIDKLYAALRVLCFQMNEVSVNGKTLGVEILNRERGVESEPLTMKLFKGRASYDYSDTYGAQVDGHRVGLFQLADDSEVPARKYCVIQAADSSGLLQEHNLVPDGGKISFTGKNPDMAGVENAAALAGSRLFGWEQVSSALPADSSVVSAIGGVTRYLKIMRGERQPLTVIPFPGYTEIYSRDNAVIEEIAGRLEREDIPHVLGSPRTTVMSVDLPFEARPRHGAEAELFPEEMSLLGIYGVRVFPQSVGHSTRIRVGRVKFDDVRDFVFAGEGEIALNPGGCDNALLMTKGMISCRGLLIYDPEGPDAALGHVISPTDEMAYAKMMINRLSERGARKFVFLATANLDDRTKAAIEAHIRGKGDLVKSGKSLPSEAFAIYTRSKTVVDLQASESSGLRDAINEVAEKNREALRLADRRFTTRRELGYLGPIDVTPADGGAEDPGDIEDEIARAEAFVEKNGETDFIRYFENQHGLTKKEQRFQIIAAYYYNLDLFEGRGTSASKVVRSLERIHRGPFKAEESRRIEKSLRDSCTALVRRRLAMPYGKTEYAGTGWIRQPETMKEAFDFNNNFKPTGSGVRSVLYAGKQVVFPEQAWEKLERWFSSSRDAERRGILIARNDISTGAVIIEDFIPEACLIFDAQYLGHNNRAHAFLKGKIEGITGKVMGRQWESEMPAVVQTVDKAATRLIPREILIQTGLYQAEYDVRPFKKTSSQFEIECHSHAAGSDFPAGPSPIEAQNTSAMEFLYSCPLNLDRNGAIIDQKGIFFGGQLSNRKNPAYTVFDFQTGNTFRGDILDNPKIQEIISRTSRPEGARESERIARDGGNDAPGGIDFRGFPAKTRKTRISFSSAHNSLLPAADLDKEWTELEKMVYSGLCPSVQRIGDFISACNGNGRLAEYAGRMAECIAEELRMEEQMSRRTEPGMREILVFLGEQ